MSKPVKRTTTADTTTMDTTTITIVTCSVVNSSLFSGVGDGDIVVGDKTWELIAPVRVVVVSEAPSTTDQMISNEKCRGHVKLQNLNSLLLWETSRLHKMTITSFAITVYRQCCRRHVVGQPVVSDISVVRSCWSIFVASVLNLIMQICYHTCLLLYILGKSVLLHRPNITRPTTWRRVLGDHRQKL